MMHCSWVIVVLDDSLSGSKHWGDEGLFESTFDYTASFSLVIYDVVS